jgi:hypothetical protein
VFWQGDGERQSIESGIRKRADGRSSDLKRRN